MAIPSHAPSGRPFFVALIACLLVTSASGQTVLQTFSFNHYWDKVTLIGDVDGDGVRDLAFERYMGSSGMRPVDIYSVRTGALLFHFAPPPGVTYIEVKRVGDVDNDGHDDIAYWELGGNNGTVVRSGQTGAYLHTFWPGGFVLVGVDDVNGDGSDDLFLSDSLATVNGNTYAGRADLIDGATGQVLRSHTGTYPSQDLHVRTALGDLDGDGMRDYLIDTNSHWYGHSGATGQQLFALPKLSFTYGLGFTDVGDVNADGFDDIAFRDNGNPPYIGNETTFVYAGPAATQLLFSHTTAVLNPGPVYYYDHFGKLGDLDGDGHDDIGLQGGAAGVAWTALSGRTLDALVEVTAGSPYITTLQHRADGPGDVDDDGIPDLLLHHWPTATTREVRLVTFAPPGVTTLGQPCPGPSGHTPTIGVGIGPRLGKTMTVNLSGANPATLAALLGVGYGDQQYNGVPLPLDLAVLGMPGCMWRVDIEYLSLVPTTGNNTPHHATHSLAVPQVPALLGTDLFWQWLLLEPGPSISGSVSRAVRTTVVQ